jgi:hypothetical protein
MSRTLIGALVVVFAFFDYACVDALVSGELIDNHFDLTR